MNDPAPAVVDDIEVESSQPVAVSAAPAAVPQAVSLEASEEADDTRVSDPGDEQPEPTPKAKPRNSVQARIDKAVAEQRAAERRAEAAEAALAQRQPAQPEPTARQADAFLTRPEPSEDEVGTKYETYGEFVKDHGRWVRDEMKAEAAEQAQRAEMAQRHDAHASQFVERIAAAEAVDPEFWSKISPDVANLRPSSALDPRELSAARDAARQGHPGARVFLGKTLIADMVFDSDVSTDLMAYFSANHTEFQRLSTLPPSALSREMGKLEATFHRPAAAPAGPARVTPPVSQAAPPIKPVGSTASAPERDPLADDLDVDEHIRVMNARDRKTARR